MTDVIDGVETTVLEGSFGPNASIYIDSGGMVRVALFENTIAVTTSMDGISARALAKHLTAAADEFDRVWAELEAAKNAADDNVISFDDADFEVVDSKFVVNEDSEVNGEGSDDYEDEALSHDIAVEQAEDTDPKGD